MSTLAEIEKALPQLSAEDLRRLEAALRRIRQGVGLDVAELERRNGFAVLPERTGARATIEAVRQLCMEEGA